MAGIIRRTKALIGQNKNVQMGDTIDGREETDDPVRNGKYSERKTM